MRVAVRSSNILSECNNGHLKYFEKLVIFGLNIILLERSNVIYLRFGEELNSVHANFITLFSSIVNQTRRKNGKSKICWKKFMQK